jgi:hypothetical protein
MKKKTKNTLTEGWLPTITGRRREKAVKAKLVDQPRVQSGLADVDEPPIGARKPERQIEK